VQLDNRRRAGFVYAMKTNRRLPTFLSLALLFATPFLSRAQDDSSAANDTNAPPLKELMRTNDVVTNTVGIVLVKISPGFWAGKYEVTQSAWQKVMGGNPSAFSGANRPVDSVSWNDAMSFCKKLTEKEQRAKQLPARFGYTLPTQAQWEQLVDDASLDDAVMSLNIQHRTSTAPVGSLKPNSLGLYDTRGNVLEWCLDPQDQPYRVLRGGAWDTDIEVNSRTEFRWYFKPDAAKNTFGLRVVLEPLDK
jgi:formylglycine-generating enzyme required for sulfatase activity